jgi:hypothetical protein
MITDHRKPLVVGQAVSGKVVWLPFKSLLLIFAQTINRAFSKQNSRGRKIDRYN